MDYTPAGQIPTLVLDAAGTPYEYDAGAGTVCRLDPSLCTAANANVCVSAFDWDIAAGKIASDCGYGASPGISCSGSSPDLRIGTISMRASTVDPGVLYAAYAAPEGATCSPPNTNIYFTRVVDGLWSATAATVAAGTSGLMDFFPQIAVTGHDTIGIAYYRREGTCAAGANRCVTLRAVTSVDSGASWGSGPAVSGIGDLCDLPMHCFDEPTRFLGDYRESVSALLHGHLLFSAPDLSEHARLFTNFFSTRYRW